MFYPPLIGYLIMALTGTVLTILISRNQLARNRAIGFRSRHTLASDAAWRHGHRAAVPALLTLSVIAIGFALALAGVELFSWPTATGHVLSIVGWVLILGVGIKAWAVANTAAKSVDD
ncbi:SdpI family protein [Brevibacterium spongiae]|uniref:SdpI family protein n=1 Tax=Brevibacterium spongiae TaxID=2909672 RepID=A0ABY5SKL1_9MICO|nr:SdpI family protein [Brevibacterium spongiae]UVI35078.1 SdpI family protein [Brevibacterium spongiae]